ncbi:hypothetical protein E2C01_048284 [Portunus trituberculatus]|uniref:Uncharacterized protein n=1 Tax=Portunus trituberculatus TaxID=210409 RepID=A0A5B7GAR6_PORTR|nr:hypothetical protein [Portunus trituberculatus]
MSDALGYHVCSQVMDGHEHDQCFENILMFLHVLPPFSTTHPAVHSHFPSPPSASCWLLPLLPLLALPPSPRANTLPGTRNIIYGVSTETGKEAHIYSQVFFLGLMRQCSKRLLHARLDTAAAGVSAQLVCNALQWKDLFKIFVRM